MIDSRIPLLDDVRLWIDLYGKKVASLRDQRNTEIELLRLRDSIQDALDHYREKGAYLDPECTRLGNHDSAFQGKAFTFVRMTGSKKLANARNLLTPAPERWWWFLDRTVSEQKRRWLKKFLKNLSIAVSIFLVVYFVFLRLPPDEKKYFDVLSSIEQIADDFTRTPYPAQQEILLQEGYELSLSIQNLFPERSNPYLIAGVIQEIRSQEPVASTLLAEAAMRFEDEKDFLVEKAGWFIRFGKLDAAFNSVALALEGDRNHLGAWNLQGMIFEMQGNIPEALRTYERVLELAEEQGVTTLIPITRIKMAMLRLRPPMPVP
ncbi:MAG TPA: tetratricopeptide repeat protein [Atribacteraceae bacterium]|nr:tetratricopeptide repeat protein [Atribacteraceae bacterium]